MSETAAKELIRQEKNVIYDLISSQKILTATGAEALGRLELALGEAGGGGATPNILELDSRDLEEDTEIESGYAYIYLDVIVGPVVINGLTWETGYVVNREPVHGFRYPALSLQIPSGSKIRLEGAK